MGTVVNYIYNIIEKMEIKTLKHMLLSYIKILVLGQIENVQKCRKIFKYAKNYNHNTILQ